MEFLLQLMSKFLPFPFCKYPYSELPMQLLS